MDNKWSDREIITLLLGELNIMPEVRYDDEENVIELDLSSQQLSELPLEIYLLTNLQVLSLADNRLRYLPTELEQLPHLQHLYLDNNPQLISPPPEIIARGTAAVLTFLRELRRGQKTAQKTIIRHEAKLLVVGEGGTGKSSLLRSLRGDRFSPKLNTTHGIEIGKYRIQHPTQNSTKITLNTWDFGGQQIYHATHQFFLTHRSLYIVVWNARLGAEQGRLHYWLDTIKALAPDSPVLLVATHIDERAPDLNYQLYKDVYPRLVSYIKISNKTQRGIAELKTAIATHAARLPLIGQPWPETWIYAEREILKRSQHHIDADAYIECCIENEIDEEVARGTLGDYLHDLGKILYFRDDDTLCNMIVLKPNWVTKAISRVLTNSEVSAARGILHHAELRHIWAKDDDGHRYERHLHPIFLRLMERFELSYQLVEPGELAKASLIPQLLPHEPPADLPTWPTTSSASQSMVAMVYRLEFVPAGIMSWFIVRTHRYTLNLHWRDGVVLEYEGHYARAELNPMARQLWLSVYGPFPENFFTILMKTIDDILSRFEGLSIRREIPCICHRQRNVVEPCPRFHRYEDLVGRRKAGKDFIECLTSFEDVSVLELLYGIHLSTDRQIMLDIKQGQEEIRNEIDEQRVLLDRLHQQSELLNRNFTRQWNMLMRNIEAECPNTFYLMPGRNTITDTRNWASREYTLYLVCQHPARPHGVSEGYSVRQPKTWWTSLAPWLYHLIIFLKFAVPMGGKIAGVAYEKTVMDEIKSSIELMEQITKSLPKVATLDSISRTPAQPEVVEEEQVAGPALRVLHSFLKEVDPMQRWGDLHKIVTPDGNILWLCGEHRAEYEVKLVELN